MAFSGVNSNWLILIRQQVGFIAILMLDFSVQMSSLNIFYFSPIYTQDKDFKLQSYTIMVKMSKLV